MQCRSCRNEIEVGWYIRYKDLNFCDRDCLAEYLVDQAEDNIEEIWLDSDENLQRLTAEEREEIRRDLGGYYDN